MTEEYDWPELPRVFAVTVTVWLEPMLGGAV